MTAKKQKVIHVVVDAEMHRRIVEAGKHQRDDIPFGITMSDVVRWVLRSGLEAIESVK